MTFSPASLRNRRHETRGRRGLRRWSAL